MQPLAPNILPQLTRLLKQTWLWGVVCLLAMVVLRRLMGSFHTPLTFSTAVVFGLLVALHSYGLRSCLRREVWQSWPVLEFDRKVSLATWLLLFTLIIPGTDNLTWMMLLLPWAAADLYWWCAHFEPSNPLLDLTAQLGATGQRSRSVQLADSSLHTGRRCLPVPRNLEVLNDTPGEVSEETAVEGLVATQRVIHHDTYELVAGEMQVEFLAEQQTAVVHIPFHPPLSHDPEIIAEAEECQVRVTEARTYGMRLEVKRASSSLSPAKVQLSYEALVEKEEV